MGEISDEKLMKLAERLALTVHYTVLHYKQSKE
jgi:hypothetical protein